MAVLKLLVEGNDDQDFFKAYCQKLGLPSVDVFPPKKIDANTGDGWGNLVKNLPILLAQIKAGDIDKLGIILDADFPPENNGGFTKRHELVSSQLKEAGYVIPSKLTFNKGDIFVHSDGLPNVGLWIMPNHQVNGMLESFIESIITSDANQPKLIAHASSVISKLPVTLFDAQLRTIKAKIFTWRAWQTRPGLPLNKALNDGILDATKAKNFEAWLKNTFK